MTSKSVLETLQKKNEDLLSQNIPMLQNTTGFSRQDLYSFFILFKALCQITSQRYVQEKKEVNGIDFQTFKDGIFQISVQSDELARRIFFKIDRSCEGVLDWGEF